MANINQADLMKLFKQQAEEANANQIMLNMNPFMMNNTNTRNQRNQRTDDYDDDDDYNRVQRRGGGRAIKGPRGSNPREDGSCFKCGKKGHWANSCPETTKAKELEMQLQIAQLKRDGQGSCAGRGARRPWGRPPHLPRCAPHLPV